MDENIPRLWDLDQEKGLGPGGSFSLGSAWSCGMGIPKGCAGIIWEDPGGKETENTGLESSRMVLEDGMAGGRQERVPKAGFGHHGSIPGHSRGMGCAIRTEIQPGNFFGIRPHLHCWKLLVGAKVGGGALLPPPPCIPFFPRLGIRDHDPAGAQAQGLGAGGEDVPHPPAPALGAAPPARPGAHGSHEKGGKR